ncbi:MAG: ABC transporter permease [Phycisphaerae bacterium]|nr:ABC transporter permease [Phycisphaerae bacterium]
MRKILVIAVREYQAAVRTKMFIITLVLMPVLCTGGLITHKLLGGQVDTTDRRVAVIDRSGILFDVLAKASDERNASLKDPKTGEKTGPAFFFDSVAPDDADPDGQRLALSNDIRQGRYFAFIEIGPDVVEPEADPERACIEYYTDTPMYFPIQKFVDSLLNNAIQSHRLAKAGIDKTVVDRATRWVPVETLGLVQVDAKTGEVRGADRKSIEAHVGVVVFCLFLVFMVITVGAVPLMQSVLEEKMQRIAEVLLGSVTPFQLMAGKLLGVVGVSLTVLVLYVIAGVGVAEAVGLKSVATRSLIAWIVAYQMLAILMFGSFFSAIGAACSDLKEAQSAFLPVWLIVCVPMFMLGPILEEPTSTFATVVSLIPLFTPIVMIVRLAAVPVIPLWQPMLGVVLTLAMTALAVFASGRIFRVGLLMQGKGASFRDMLRWAIRG